MDLVKIIYKYANRFIDGDELLNELNLLNKDEYDKEELDKFIKDIENAINDSDITIDEALKERSETLDKLMPKLKEAYDVVKDNNDAKKLESVLDSIINSKPEKRDSGNRYNEVMKTIYSSELYNNELEKLTLEELSSLITNYIKVPCPPNITKETFDKLLDLAMSKNAREDLWRLAFNYEDKDMNFDKIVDYYIDKKDSYYLVELISICKDELDMKRTIDELINTNDLNFIKESYNKAEDIKLFDDKEKEYIKNRYAELNKQKKRVKKFNE